MGLQLILCVETNKKTKSDYIYIKETIDYFYTYDQAEIKISPVYMDSKTKYEAKQRDVKRLKKIYKDSSSNNRSVVIYCFDLDNYDSRYEDKEFITKAKDFCKKYNYEFIWFCKDIESVYLGKKVLDKHKGREAVSFKQRKKIVNVNQHNLRKNQYSNGSSNICFVLDKYLKRK